MAVYASATTTAMSSFRLSNANTNAKAIQKSLQFRTVKSFFISPIIIIPRNRFNNKSSRDSSSCSCSCYSATKEAAISSGKGKAAVRRVIVEIGMLGLMAASIVGFSMDANATRIEYYATVSEPSCVLNFVPSGLGYCDVVLGSGPQAPYNDLINIHYTARFGDETVFDSSYKRGRPLTMRIGVGKVIKGLDQGIFGGDGVPPMQVGGKRKLRIPPELAYGPEAAGCFSGDCNIPANATLLYDINFVNIYSGNRSK